MLRATGSKKWLAALAASMLGVAGAAMWPVTTKQGVNFEVSTTSIPLGLKAFEFVDRSAQYRRLAADVTHGAGSDRERVLAAFEWTRRHVQATPEGLPVVDDHILNIIIRGYGAADQQADVFTTLTTYAGVPAFWYPFKFADSAGDVLLSFARVDGRWAVFDAALGVIFRTNTGDLATLDDLRNHPELIPEDVRQLDVRGRKYGDIVPGLTMPAVPHPLRAELQMPSVRLWHELKHSAGLEQRYDPY
jgi:hypothetical protein